MSVHVCASKACHIECLRRIINNESCLVEVEGSTCKVTSLMTTPPAETLFTNCSLSCFLLVNKYAASGFDFELIKSMPSSIFSTYIINRNKTQWPKVIWMFWTKWKFFTVTIGSKGPNISSFIIKESSGASSKMVGEIFLKQTKSSISCSIGKL